MSNTYKPPFPTGHCFDQWHRRGGACQFCCDSCNYNRHICPACGDNLQHDGIDFHTGQPHYCITPCVHCGHIGHEHVRNPLDREECRECSGKPCTFEPVPFLKAL